VSAPRHSNVRPQTQQPLLPWYTLALWFLLLLVLLPLPLRLLVAEPMVQLLSQR
jgi:hypothetical protein